MKRRGRSSRSRFVVIAVAAVVAAVAAGFIYIRYFGADYPSGQSKASLVVAVSEGASQKQIGQELVAKGVVASAAAFVTAAAGDSKAHSIQPGYYFVPTHLSAEEAVAALTDPGNRVGHLVFEGKELHDKVDGHSGAVNKGLYRMIAEASCVDSTCVTYEQLDEAGAFAALEDLGVPEWARERVASVTDPNRRLEGLIAPGDINFNPTNRAVDILRELITDSVARYEATGLLTSGSALTPYDQLVAASLVQREGSPADFPMVARVILNRLAVNQKLQFDSTVNYALDTTAVATTDDDRQRVTPWNTYTNYGLPATPIVSPSLKALEAVEHPAEGDWLYFVTVDENGTTRFTADYQEHLRNQEEALRNGFLRGGGQ